MKLKKENKCERKAFSILSLVNNEIYLFFTSSLKSLF